MHKIPFFKPYLNEEANLAYNRLFCDNLKLYKDYPDVFHDPDWQPVLSARPKLADVRILSLNPETKTGARILAYNYLSRKGESSSQKELLGIIMEAGIDDGLETLAAFTDLSALYINSSGEIHRWDAPQIQIKNELLHYFALSASLAAQLKPSGKPRFPPPFAGMARITLLLSDGLYFGQGPGNNLTKDPLSGPVIRQANHWLGKLLTGRLNAKNN